MTAEVPLAASVSRTPTALDSAILAVRVAVLPTVLPTQIAPLTAPDVSSRAVDRLGNAFRQVLAARILQRSGGCLGGMALDILTRLYRANKARSIEGRAQGSPAKLLVLAGVLAVG